MLFKSLVKTACAVALLSTSAVSVFAEQQKPSLKEIEKQVSSKLREFRPDIPVQGVSATEVPGLYEVNLAGGSSLYTTADGSYLIDGTIYELDGAALVNIREKKLKPERAAAIATISEGEMISFNSKQKGAKDIYVFTDVDCGYCRKLHQEVPRLNELGVNVHYLAYPRSGIGQASYNKMQAAWCAKDPQQAMNELKNQRSVAMLTCDSDAVASQFALGNKLGVSGTPAIILSDGTLLPGYQPAEQLAKLAK
ncbi:DsbC family protein [Agaribacterium sp. ZY112]|uniref:DsbC family protein n=1 Tax=Agaribacterium sp. ZY112 TaxID=3233574 RepID=UPI0035252385